MQIVSPKGYTMPYLEGDISKLIEPLRAPLSPPTILSVLAQCVDQLQVLHSMGIVHGDVKPHNFCYEHINSSNQSEQQLKVWIVDFGSAFVLDEDYQGPCGQTWWYRAPEYSCKSAKIGPAVDVWGIGCILFQLLTQQPLIDPHIDEF